MLPSTFQTNFIASETVPTYRVPSDLHKGGWPDVHRPGKALDAWMIWVHSHVHSKQHNAWNALRCSSWEALPIGRDVMTTRTMWCTGGLRTTLAGVSRMQAMPAQASRHSPASDGLNAGMQVPMCDTVPPVA